MEMTLSPLILYALKILLSILILIFVLLKYTKPKKVSERVKESIVYVKSRTAKKTIGVILFTIGGIPLLIYPFVLLANLMQIAGYWEVHEKINVILLICIVLFLLFSSIYPFTYIVCFISFFRKYKNDIEKNRIIVIPVIPLLQILLTVFLYYICGILQ